MVIKKKNKTKKKSTYKPCPYDKFACRVYSFCGTKRCLSKKK